MLRPSIVTKAAQGDIWEAPLWLVAVPESAVVLMLAADMAATSVAAVRAAWAVDSKQDAREPVSSRVPVARLASRPLPLTMRSPVTVMQGAMRADIAFTAKVMTFTGTSTTTC